MSRAVSKSFGRLTEAFRANLDLGMKIGEKNFKSFFSDPETFAEEPYKGITPFEVIYQFDAMRLFRFKGPKPATERKPILLVPALINRSYVMDLMEGSSLAAELVAQGIPAYLVDWGEPGPQHDHLPFRFYFDDLLSFAVNEVRRDAKSEKIGLLGYCMGGTMSLLHTALHSEKIERLTLLATPVNFHDGGTLSKWASKEVFDVEDLMETIGHADASMLQASFLWLKPLSYYQKLRNIYETSPDPKAFKSFVRLESWVNDISNVPGKAYAEFIKMCYHENSLMKRNFLTDGGETVINLSKISCPILTILGTKDHIVSPHSSRAVAELVGGKVRELIVDAGHIGIVMGRRARKVFETVGHFHLEKLDCCACPEVCSS